MDNLMSSVFVPLYFIHITFAMAVLAWWFSSRKELTLKYFGWGLAGYALGIGVWTVAILTKPTNLEPLILLGVIPFLLAHLAYAKATSVRTKNQLVLGLTLTLLVVTFIARTFFYPSKPYFSDQGYFYFGLMAVPLALYIATISTSFLPAILAVTNDIKQKSIRPIMNIGLVIVFINMIVQISVQDETVRIINGVVASGTLLVLWVTAVTNRDKA